MTKNKGKLQAAASIFDKYGIEVRSLDFDIPEIQADTSSEIAKNMVLQAFEKFKEPIIREDRAEENRVFTEYSSDERNHVWNKNYEEIGKLLI